MIRTTNSCCGNEAGLVEKFIGTAYDVVKTVYDNLGELQFIYDFLNKYGVLITVSSVQELQALPTTAKYTRVYSTSNAGERIYTDYLYVDGDTSGVIPSDPTATGSWVIVGTSGNGGSGASGGYIPFVYNNGSALGDETTITVPDGTVGVPFIIVNGYTNYVGKGFTYSVADLEVTLAQPLETGDEVVLLLTGVPAVPDNPNVDSWTVINWLYNQGAAVGGEQVIQIPYTFQDIPAVFKNGLRFYKNLTSNSYTIDADNQRIILTEPLATNDRLIVQVGGELVTLEASDRTLEEVARSANVKDSEVILSTDTTSTLNGKKVVFDVTAQKSYGLPTLPSNVYISSVSNGQLTYLPGNITVNLLVLPNEATTALKDTLASSTGYTHIGGLDEHFSLPNRWVVVDNAPYNGDLKAAWQAEPEGTAFLLGKQQAYDISGLFASGRNTKKNITLFGSGMPQLAANKNSLVEGTGTVIKGAVKNEATGFQIVNLGIDCGNDVTAALYAGNYEDPMQCYGVGANANFYAHNVKPLSHTNHAGPTYPGTHAFLLEGMDGAVVGYVEPIGGFHGLTMKCSNLKVQSAHCYGQKGDAFILKSDSGAVCRDVTVGTLKVGLYDNTGWADVTMGGIYDAHDGVSIDNVEIGSLIINNASWGLIPSDANTGFITNFRINSYTAMNVYGNYYTLTIDEKCVGFTVGDHQCSNTSGAIRADASSVNVSIGNGFSKGSTKSGYALGGNSLIHGTLIANENGEYGVDYLGGVGLDISKIRGFVNGFGLVSAVPTAKDGGPKNGWSDSGGFDLTLTGKTVTVTGEMIRGTAAIAYTALAICQPRKRTPIAAWGVSAGSVMVPVECYVETNGDLNVAGYASIPVGGTIYFSGQFLTK